MEQEVIEDAQPTTQHGRAARLQPPKSVTYFIGFHFLSKSEQELCQNFHILPHQFLLVKEAFVSEYVKTCDLAKNTALQLTDMGTFRVICHPHNLEADKAGKIYDFMQEVGWINNSGHKAGLPALQQRNAQNSLNAQIEKDKEKEQQQSPHEVEQEQGPKPQPLASYLRKPSSAPPLRFGTGPRTANLFTWQRT